MKVKRLNIVQSPVTLEQAKRHLRITSNDFDADISGKLEAANTARRITPGSCYENTSFR